MTKDEKEIAACKKVAEAINKAEGTDFTPLKAQSRAPDVVLRSTSGRYADRLLEVVTIPRDVTMREDNSNILRLEDELRMSLLEAGVKGCDVDLNIRDEVYKQGIGRRAIRELAELIAAEPKRESWRVTGVELRPHSKELSRKLYSVRVHYHPKLRDVSVCAGLGGWIPADGVWIEEAISMKLKKYGGPKAVQDWILVIGASLFVDAEQIESFRSTHRQDTLPFREIWLVSPFHGVVPLKRSL